MATMDFLASCARLAELWCTRHGAIAPGEAAAHRLRALVRHARERSPLYRELFRGLPADPPLERLPVVSKRRLMARFDDWVTDPAVRLAAVRAFLRDPRHVGQAFLDRYQAWKSSGTTGEAGIFLQDANAMAAYDALVAIQLHGVRWRADTAARLLRGAGRAALVAATGDHYASISSWERLRRTVPALEARSFSVLMPMARLVAALNEWQPAFLAGYPSVLELLAAEQEAGRLAIAPALAWSGGEHLRPRAARAIERAFGCAVMNEYGASECLSMAYGCEEGWLHVNAEWVVVEPVDRHGRPVPPGSLSHSALVTNLANRVQPIIRYDIGDRILAREGPCGCGDPSPAIRVEGRTADTLVLRAPTGARVELPPLALATVVERSVGVRRFQLAQTAPDRLALRVAGRRGRALQAARTRAAAAVAGYLRAQSLPNVSLVLDEAPPRRDARSGKVREVIVRQRRV